jgi:hypothetical protein
MGSAVAVTPEFNGGDDWKKVVKGIIEKIVYVTVSQMEQTGLKVVRDARVKTPSEGGYHDETGNLRSSIGFAVVNKSEIAKKDFTPSSDGSDKATGVKTGEDYASKIAEEDINKLALIVVAGMDYAGYVEALGYDVITGSTLGVGKKFEKDLNEALSHIDFDSLNKIDFGSPENLDLT